MPEDAVAHASRPQARLLSVREQRLLEELRESVMDRIDHPEIEADPERRSKILDMLGMLTKMVFMQPIERPMTTG